MHGHVDTAEFLGGVSGFLGGYYLALAVMNATAALYLWRTGRQRTLCDTPFGPFTTATLWLLVSMAFVVMAPIALTGDPFLMGFLSIPEVVRDQLDKAMGPVAYSVGTLVLFAVLYVGRKFFVQPEIA